MPTLTDNSLPLISYRETMQELNEEMADISKDKVRPFRLKKKDMRMPEKTRWA